MLHTLRMIPDAGCTDPFHIQRRQKPGSKESWLYELKDPESRKTAFCSHPASEAGKIKEKA